jgi:hypothetical protein
MAPVLLDILEVVEKISGTRRQTEHTEGDQRLE